MTSSGAASAAVPPADSTGLLAAPRTRSRLLLSDRAPGAVSLAHCVSSFVASSPVVKLVMDIELTVFAAGPTDRQFAQRLHLVERNGPLAKQFQQGKKARDDGHGVARIAYQGTKSRGSGSCVVVR